MRSWTGTLLALLSLASNTHAQTATAPSATAPSASATPTQPQVNTEPSARAQPPTAQPPNAEPREPKRQKLKPHRGFFAHADLGLGYGWIFGGSLGPEPGFKPVNDLSFSGPVLNTSLQLGGGGRDLSVAAELLYEVMLTEREQPSNIGFQMFGIGLGATYYTDDDYLLGAQLRYLGMILWREDVPCFWDRAVGTSGPGVGVTLGKEWFGRSRRRGHTNERKHGGIGLALQGNYAAFQSDPNFRYLSLLLQLSLTRF